MDTRIGIAAGLAIAVLGLFFGLYEVQKWTMPKELAIVLLVVIVTMGCVLVGVVFHAAWVWLRPRVARYGLRLPFYDRNKPDPLQWLIDIANAEREAPANRMYITGRFIDLTHLDDPDPYVLFRVHVRVDGLYAIFWEGIEGKCDYLGKPLLNDIEELNRGGRSRWLRGHEGVVRLRQFIPKYVVNEIKLHIAADPSVVREFSFRQVTMTVTADASDGGTNSRGLGGDEPFMVEKF